eukprot:11564007-Alexandrium_andersonii.AAC.1
MTPRTASKSTSCPVRCSALSQFTYNTRLASPACRFNSKDNSPSELGPLDAATRAAPDKQAIP